MMSVCVTLSSATELWSRQSLFTAAECSIWTHQQI